jgi:hypothetical protein
MAEPTPYQQELLAILRRTAQRGRALALENEDIDYVDLFQHVLDELKRLDKTWVTR